MAYTPLTPEQFQKARAAGFSTEKIIQLEQERKQKESGNILDKAADTVNSVYEGYKNLPVIKQARQVVGGAVGAAGLGIGGIIGGLGETGLQITNAVKGKKVDLSKIIRSSVESAKSTGQFGFDIGSEGAAAAPLGAAGKLVTIPLGLAQTYQGGKDVVQGVKTGNTEQAVTGGIETATGLLGLKGAVTSKGLVLNRGPASVVSPIERTKAMTKAESQVSSILQTGKQRLKDELKADVYGKTSRNPERTFLEEKVVLQKGPNQSIDATLAIKDNLLPKANQIHEQVVTSLQNKTPRYSLTALLESALTDIRNRRGLSATERKSMVAELTGIVNDEVEHYGTTRAKELGKNPKYMKPEEVKRLGDKLTDQELEYFKEGLWNMGYDQGRPVKNATEIRQLGSKARDLLVESNKDKNVQELLKREGDIRNLISILEGIHGAKIRGGLLGKRLNQMLGAGVGLVTSGPFGALAGYEAAGRITEAVLSPERRSRAAIRTYEKGQ